MMSEKPVIYQIFTRLFGNRQAHPVVNGDIHENGCGKMDDLDEATIARIKQMGVTHIWLTGIIRHATTTDYTSAGIPRQTPMVVKGKAGSPYAITDYYDVDPDLAVDVERRMDKFGALVGRIHQAGLKVVIDFVPNHVAREYRSVCKPDTVRDLGQDDDTFLHFSTRNNFYYCWGHDLDVSQLPVVEGPAYHEQPARATGNDQFGWCPNANDWYETVKLNYGIDYCDAGGRTEHFCPIPETWGKMTDILLFWAAKGVDAFRCDMAEMVPAAFWHWATDKVKFAYQNVKFIGEVYDPGQYRNYIAAGFDYLYDKVGMYDCLREVICGRRKASDITQQWQVNDDILSHMLYFLENHDEQRVASDFFAADARKGVPGMMVCAWLNSSSVMVYAGQEFGERGMDAEGFSGLDGRTTIFDYWTVDTIRRGYYDRRRLKKTEKDLLEAYSNILSLANKKDALREGAFYDLMYVNPQIAEHQFAFMRKKDNQLMLIVVNFDEKEADCQVNLPEHVFGWWHLPEGHFPATNLMNGEKSIVALCSNHPVALTVPPLGGCLIEIMI